MEQFFNFMKNSPTCYHAVEQIILQLKEQGFLPLEEREEYCIEPGKKYYVVRNNSSLLAFKIPEGEIKGFRLMASHSDSPCFKLKE